MKLETAFAVVAKAIANEFAYDAARVTPETTVADVAGWDSFSNGLLMMAIETELGVVLPLDQLLEAPNVGSMAEIIARAAE